MLSAALDIEDDAWSTPRSAPSLPRVLEMCRNIFFALFSTSGRKTWEMYAGPKTFVWNTSGMIVTSIVNALSLWPGFCGIAHRQPCAGTNDP